LEEAGEKEVGVEEEAFVGAEAQGISDQMDFPLTVFALIAA
jgi:hypothetical protein